MYRDHRKGPGGSTGWGHLSQRAPWAEVGREPAHSGLGHPHGPPPLRLGLETLGWGAPHLTWGVSYPPGRPPIQMGSGRRPPSQGAYIKWGGRAATLQPWAPPSSPATPLSLAEGRRSPADIPLHPPPRRRAAGSPSTSPSPLLDQEGGDVFPSRTCVERGGVVR